MLLAALQQSTLMAICR